MTERRGSSVAARLALATAVVAMLVVAIVAATGDDPDDNLVSLGEPFELEDDVQLTVTAVTFDDADGRLRAEVGYRNRSSLAFTGPQFAVACASPPPEASWATPMLEGSVDALGALEAKSAGGGTVVVEYERERLASCGNAPVLWVRSGVLRDVNDQPGYRTFSVPLERELGS